MHIRLKMAFLTLFLGGIGLHKFYIERYWDGVVYFFFAWTCIPLFF